VFLCVRRLWWIAGCQRKSERTPSTSLFRRALQKQFIFICDLQKHSFILRWIFFLKMRRDVCKDKSVQSDWCVWFLGSIYNVEVVVIWLAAEKTDLFSVNWEFYVYSLTWTIVILHVTINLYYCVWNYRVIIHVVSQLAVKMQRNNGRSLES